MEDYIIFKIVHSAKYRIMNKIIKILVLSVGVMGYEAYGEAPKYSNEFLEIGVGAQNLGMAKSVVATTGDITSGFFNPAGLTSIKSNIEIGYMHAEYFAGIAKYDYLGAAFQLDSGKHYFGLNALRFGVDDIPDTRNLVQPDGSINYDEVRSFSVGDYGIALSYARKIKHDISLGGTVKIVHRSAGNFAKAWGFGIDVGAQYKYRDFRFAAMIKDATSTFNAWSFNFSEQDKIVFQQTGNDIPENGLEVTLPKLILGTAYQKSFKKFDIKTEVDIVMTTDGKRNVLISANPLSFDPTLGVEIGFAGVVYARGGINNIQRYTTSDGSKKFTLAPNAGIGLKFKTVNLDYAFTNIGNNAFYSHVVSARIGFNKKNTL